MTTEPQGQNLSKAQSNESLLQSLRIAKDHTLRRKETYEYQTPYRIYDVELFEHADGTYHAIGLPRDTDKVVVYGSSVFPSAKYALQNLIDKITRDGVDVLFGDEVAKPSDDVYADDDDEDLEPDE